MKRYIALLRGINISGKNKISMSDLKLGFEELGYTDVKTHLNSGNVIFSSNENQNAVLTNQIRTMIKSKFDLDIPVVVMGQEELKEILQNAPDWWGSANKTIYDNLIFIIPPTTFDEVYREIGEPMEELEKIQNYKDTIFWSFSLKDYQKTNWWPKTAGANICNKLTIRTANTVRKIAEK